MVKKLKIGILFKQKNQFFDWQIKIIEEIFNSDFADIVCTFSYKSEKNTTLNFLINLLNNILYFIISLIENKYSKVQRLEKLKIVQNYLSQIQKYEVTYRKEILENNFFAEKTVLQKASTLDILICFDAKNLKGRILLLPKHGTWLFNYGVNETKFAGFWECFNNSSITIVILQKIKQDKSIIILETIDKGFYSTKMSSWFLNREFITEKSSTLLLKNLRLTANGIKQDNDNLNSAENKNYNNPNFLIFVIYILRKYPKAILRKIFKLKKKDDKEPKYNPWNLHIGKKTIDLILPLADTKRLIPPENNAWCDPFLISIDEKKYLFFENYEYKSKKGKISFTEIKNNNITTIQDALILDYHLSYPFVWQENKDIFMMPETADTKRVEIWKASEFLTKWKLHKVLFEGESCVDTTLFKNNNGDIWLFTNKSNDKFNDHNSELYIYKIENEFNKITPHILNPVITDCRIARNAGNIFYDNKNTIIRPSQINISDFYGGGLNLRKIQELNLEKFRETNMASYFPNFTKNINALHHFTQNKDTFVVDVRYKKGLLKFLPKVFFN